MSQLRQVFLAHADGNHVLVLEAFLPDRFDPNPAGLGQVGPHRTAIVRVWNALDEAVPLEVVDQSGDVAWRGTEVRREVPEMGRPAPVEAEQHAQPSLAEVVFLGPTLVELGKGV